MPPRTDWFPTNQPVAEKIIGAQLQDYALRLGKLKSWLTIESPGDHGRFPYRLALTNLTTPTLIAGEPLRTEISPASGVAQLRCDLPVVKEGDRIELLLQAEPEAFQRAIDPRHVYAFLIDREGRSQLLFDGGAQPFPSRPEGGKSYPLEIPLEDAGYDVASPFGIDTIVFLTSRRQIPDSSVLKFDGVATSATRGGDEDELQNLLKSIGSSTRGGKVNSPADWSIQRLSLRSVTTNALSRPAL